MTIKQLSVFIENKPGRLAEITALLAQRKIDIRALSIADTTYFGILRIIVDRPDKAEAALKAAGLTVSITKVIAIGIPDTPGGLADALKHMRNGGISVEYLYAFASRTEKRAYVILKVDDIDNALEIISRHSIPILSEEQMIHGI